MANLPPPPPPWALLQRHPRLHDSEEITVDLSKAPATSSVALPRHLPTPHGLPYVLAADDTTGALLLSFTKPGPGSAHAHPDLAVLLVDNATLSLLTLPPRNPPIHRIDRTNAIGFMPLPTRSSSSDSNRIEYVVAELQLEPIRYSATGWARLITTNTQGDHWEEREVLIPRSHARRPWGRDGVLSHAGMIWWSDLTWGLVGFDPLALAPNLVFVQLPDGSALDFSDHPAVQGRRTLSLSGSHIRYLEISRVRDGPSRITSWTLRATATTDGTLWNWEETARATFQHICAGASYARTRLPKKVPTLAALSPLDPDMVCINQENYLVGLHLTSNRVDWVARHNSHDHIAWVIPHCFISSGGGSGALGSLIAKGFACTLLRSSSISTVMLVKVVSSSRAFSLRLWHKNHPIGHLSLVEQFGGSGSVLYSSNADEHTIPPLIVPSLRPFLLFTPIPDFDFIFNMFGIPADARIRHGMVEGSFEPSGKTRFLGSFEDETNNSVVFREHHGTPNPILMLECRLGGIEWFAIQLMSYLSCHNLTIKVSRDGTSNVSLKVKEDSTKMIKTSPRGHLVANYIPLPYLAKVATLF